MSLVETGGTVQVGLLQVCCQAVNEVVEFSSVTVEVFLSKLLNFKLTSSFCRIMGSQ